MWKILIEKTVMTATKTRSYVISYRRYYELNISSTMTNVDSFSIFKTWIYVGVWSATDLVSNSKSSIQNFLNFNEQKYIFDCFLDLEVKLWDKSKIRAKGTDKIFIFDWKFALHILSFGFLIFPKAFWYLLQILFSFWLVCFTSRVYCSPFCIYAVFAETNIAFEVFSLTYLSFIVLKMTLSVFFCNESRAWYIKCISYALVSFNIASVLVQGQILPCLSMVFFEASTHSRVS